MNDETTLAERAPNLPESLTRKPIIDLLPPEQVALLALRVNAGSKVDVTRSELAAFLELAATYQLDPFAGEVWLAKGSNDKVLIMVGRDGLRKIAQRSGLIMDGDVIHEKDTFKVERTPQGRFVRHSYGHPNERGEIIAAWCQVRTRPKIGFVSHERGFFVATVEEYAPTSENVLKYSPWGSQRSVMILAAAERQALRQATPLSGLVAQGELDRAHEAEAVIPLDTTGPLSDDPELAAQVEGLLDAAREQGHAGLASREAAAMALRGQPSDVVAKWVQAGWDALRDAANYEEPPADATVVEDDDDGEPVPAVVSEDPKTWPAWWCQECGQKNSGWARDCGRCDTRRPNPDGPAPDSWLESPNRVAPDGDAPQGALEVDA
jgi:hypothetical protein